MYHCTLAFAQFFSPVLAFADKCGMWGEWPWSMLARGCWQVRIILFIPVVDLAPMPFCAHRTAGVRKNIFIFTSQISLSSHHHHSMVHSSCSHDCMTARESIRLGPLSIMLRFILLLFLGIISRMGMLILSY